MATKAKGQRFHWGPKIFRGGGGAVSGIVGVEFSASRFSGRVYPEGRRTGVGRTVSRVLHAGREKLRFADQSFPLRTHPLEEKSRK